MRCTGLIVIVSMYCAVTTLAQSRSSLQQRLEALSDSSRGVLGVAALCLETNQQAGIRSKDAFPMMSTYKFPIGLCFLSQVHQGKHKPDDAVVITPAMFSPGFSRLAKDVMAQGGTMTVTKKELLIRMVSESDNTACDVLLNFVGGPAAVTQYIRKCGVATGMRVDRFERQLNAEALGVKQLPAKWSLQAFDSLVQIVPAGEQSEALRTVMNDSRDATTPEAMVTLLKRFYERKLPDFSNYELMLGAMTDTQTGLKRIKALLPAGTIVAHKTGTQYTIGGVNGGTNDVGIVTSPDGKRHILIAVYLKGSTLADDGREKIIARAAQEVYTELIRK